MNKEYKVYVAGGMHSDWQDEIKKLINVNIYDPRYNETKIPEEYTLMDKFGIRQSDIVFAYLEEGNPSGCGLALEIGYAKGLDIPVIFVNEKDERYLKIVEEMSDIVFDNFGDGKEYLKKITRSYTNLREI